MDAPHPPRPGDLVGEFEVVSPLKAGGMGEVYTARDARTGERVALKLMGGTSAASADRFAREVRIAGRLTHPNIVATRGCGAAPGGVPWMAMELLEGEDLESRLSRGALPVPDAVAVAIQACAALEHAHARGVVHRDIKPSNLFLCGGEAGRVKVLDFGVASLADERQLTRTGTPIGTPSYMSPEQARGDRDVDARSDLWSVGVVLYECLAGRPPFHAGSVVGTLYQIVSVEPPDLAALRRDLPRALVELVRRAMSKSRGDRPSSAAALRAALVALGPLADTAVGVDPGGAALSRTMTTATHVAPAGADEVRLVSVACLGGVRDAIFVRDVARELDGRVELLATGDTLVLFGADRWAGDEPRRAVRFARAVAPACRSVGVATGRVLRSDRSVAGQAVDDAAALARSEGVVLDDATTAFLEATAGDAASAAEARPPGGPTATHSGLFATPFVGREPELAALLQCVQAATDALRTRAVVVLGAAGMGKSRLRHEAVAAAAARGENPRWLSIRAEAARRDAPFAALRDAIDRDVGPDVAALFNPATHAGGDPVAALDRARASLRTVLEGLAAEGPMVLVVDDAQWLDMSSRAAIRWVREQDLDLPLAVWVFGRPEAAAAAADLAGPAPSFELGPLDRPPAARLLRAIAGGAPDALLDRAGGHPLFLEELARLYRERGEDALAEGAPLPVSVEGAHLAQLDELAPAEREFVKRAAVFGRTWWVEGVAHLGADPAVVPRLRGGGLVVPRPRARFPEVREFGFRSGVLQEVAYGLLPDGARARLHVRAGEWLAGRPGLTADELAHHWDRGGDRVRAALAYVAATEAAAAVADTPTACAHAGRALALTADPELRWRAVAARDDALQISGDAALQAAGLDELDELAPGLGLARETEAAWRRCYFLRLGGDDERALAAGARAIDLADRLGDARWGALVRIDAALQLSDAGRADEARAHAGRVQDLAARAGDAWLQARAAATLAYVTAGGDDPAEVLARFETAAAGFARAGDRRREALMRNNAASIMMQGGRLAEAAAELEAARAASRRVGNAATAGAATHNIGVIRRVQGDFVSAREAQDEADAVASAAGLARLASFVATERAWIDLATDADALVASAAEAARRARVTRAPALVAAALALSLRAGARRGGVERTDVDEARELAASAGEARLPLRVALWEADGRSAGDADAVRAELDALAARVREPTERAACRAYLARRYLVPSALADCASA